MDFSKFLKVVTWICSSLYIYYRMLQKYIRKMNMRITNQLSGNAKTAYWISELQVYFVIVQTIKSCTRFWNPLHGKRPFLNYQSSQSRKKQYFLNSHHLQEKVSVLRFRHNLIYRDNKNSLSSIWQSARGPASRENEFQSIARKENAAQCLSLNVNRFHLNPQPESQ